MAPRDPRDLRRLLRQLEIGKTRARVFSLRRLLFRDILRVGAVAALITVQTNLTIAIATGIVGSFGTGAIAGYGIGSRLEYLLVPLLFMVWRSGGPAGGV